MIKPRTALMTIFVIAIAGILFSGYLSYGELFTDGCGLGCTSGDEGNILGVPVCVYGLTMYIIVFIVTVLGLIKKEDKSE